MSERYPRPPLQEAIFEFFPADAPGASSLVFERLSTRFKGAMGEHERIQEQTFALTFAPEQVIPAQLPVAQDRHRIWINGRSELIQFSTSTCAYNVLSAYTAFADHLPRMQEVFAAYLEEVQPKGVLWCGQRYINKISLPNDVEPSAFFALYPRLPHGVGHRPFALQFLAGTFDGGEVVMNLALRGSDDGGTIYFLDIYARSVGELAPTIGALADWQQRAHAHVRVAFEGALTDQCRQLFLGAL